MRQLSRYIKQFAGCYLVLLAAAVTFNYLVDPYRVFWTGNPASQNPKPRAQAQIYFNKAVGIRHSNPTTLLLGNSMVQWGMHASSPGWPDKMRPIYNAGIPGSNLATALAYLNYANQLGDVEYVVLGLDYFSFLVPENSEESQFIVRGDYAKFLHSDKYSLPLLRENAIRLMSLDTLVDSAATLALLNDPYAMDVKANGDNPVNQYQKHVLEKGHGELFREKLAQSLNALKRNERIFLEGSDSSPEFIALEQIIHLCKNENIKLILFVHPYHQSLKKVIQESGRYDEYQRWLARLRNVLKSNEITQLWDFSTALEYTTEPVPEIGDRKSKMQWYWEPGHYKSTLGERIIEIIFSPP